MLMALTGAVIVAVTGVVTDDTAALAGCASLNVEGLPSSEAMMAVSHLGA